MTESEALRHLLDGGQDLGWELSVSQARSMLAYLEGILEQSRYVNLVAPISPAQGLLIHLLDSLALGLHFVEGGSPKSGQLLLDLGTGGGFPGVPLALALPACRVHLVESRQKKLLAVARVARSLPILNLSWQAGRLGELWKAGVLETPPPDLILARAVGPLKKLIKESAALLLEGATLVCWKSARISPEERRGGEREARQRGLSCLPDICYKIPRPGLLLRYTRRRPTHEHT